MNPTKVGDIITTYERGFFIVTSFAPPGLQGYQQVYYKMIAGPTGKPSNAKVIRNTYLSSCQMVTEETLTKLIDARRDEIELLQRFGIRNNIISVTV